MSDTIPYWQPYHIVFKLLSPLHIGHRKMANIQYTRRYVPAKTVWGALTAAIAKSRNNEGYLQLAEELKTHLRFSYFFLSEQEDDSTPLMPHYRSDGLYFGDHPKTKFERKFLDSYASTAIRPGVRSAEDESLHEIEILTNYAKDTHEPVYLTGYIFAEVGAENLPDWQTHIQNIRLGGERKYGFGHLQLVFPKLEPGKEFSPLPKDVRLFEQYEFIPDQPDAPMLKIPKEQPFPGHVLFDGFDAKGITGETEVLVSRETVKLNQWGVKVSKAQRCFCPGCSGFAGELAFSKEWLLKVHKKTDNP